jgi:hypothetical protein
LVVRVKIPPAARDLIERGGIYVGDLRGSARVVVDGWRTATTMAHKLAALRSHSPCASTPNDPEDLLHGALGEDVTPMWTISRRAKSTMTKQYRIWNRSGTTVRKSHAQV